MNKYLKRLERSSHCWFLIGVLFVFFLLRLPSLFEPYWYGDEGIYETLGLAISQGRTLYTEIWDNKPPLLYVTYALVHGNQFTVRLLSLITGIVAVVCFHLLAERLFKNIKASAFSTVVFAILFGLPFIEGNIANAENFMLPLIIIAAYLIYRYTQLSQRPQYLFIAGLLLGIAFLYKIVAIFDFAAFFIFIVFAFLPDKLTAATFRTFLRNSWQGLSLLILGFLLPFLGSVLYFLAVGAFDAYIHATFLSTVGYVGYNNKLFIPQGLLITKLLLLGGFVFLLFIKRKRLSLPVFFISLWVAFSLFNSFFSHRPYTHYLLVLLPSFALLLGSTLQPKNNFKYVVGLMCVIIAVGTLNFFNHWSVTKTLGYYDNFLDFIGGEKSVSAYESFFDRRTPRDTELARYITSHRKDRGGLFVWGNTAQLYYLTNTLPPGRFTVAYHIQGNKQYEKETAEALKQNPPQFIIMLRGTPPFTFPVYNYSHVLTIRDADIYERIN